jgi:hypothetical protein
MTLADAARMTADSVASTQLEGFQYFGNNEAPLGLITWCHYITHGLLISWSHVNIFRIVKHLLGPRLHLTHFLLISLQRESNAILEPINSIKF